MSEPTARPDKPRIVVYESDACQGNITGWTCDDCEDGDCEHECHDTEPTGDLRERLADALHQADAWAQLARQDDRERFADAVLPVVEAALAEQTQCVKRAEADRDSQQRLAIGAPPSGT